MTDLKGTLRAITLEIRRELEGHYDAYGHWVPGDLERRLASIGVWRNRAPVPADEVPLSPEDRQTRHVVDAFLKNRMELGQHRDAAVSEFVRECAYTWANRILALRCMEARGLIDEVILQKETYGGRSLQHNRFAKKQPERCSGQDEGLFAVLFDEFARRSTELPLLFDPSAVAMTLTPSVPALKRCIALLSGAEIPRGRECATDQLFVAPDALGWAYQYWNIEEKRHVFERVRTKKGVKIEGSEIIPATCIYTEPYIVKFLVSNSLGALWMSMHPNSRLYENWEYYVHDAGHDEAPKKPLSQVTFLDPACGSGHFLIEAFDLLYMMYLEEGAIINPAEICASILERNLYGVDIDERAVQIAALALFMKAKEKAPDFVPRRVNLVATNIRLPTNKEHLESFLRKHPEDSPLKPALVAIFEALARASELGSLLQIEQPVEKELRTLRNRLGPQALLVGPKTKDDWDAWKGDVVGRLEEHFDSDTNDPDLGTAFFGEAAGKGLSLVNVLSRRYDIVATNPPYMGSKNMGKNLKTYVAKRYAPGKRDLYAAFLLRCREMAAPNGFVAMVTQQSWMFLQSYADLRAVEEEKLKAVRAGEFTGILRETQFVTLAHLGPGAFSEISGEVVNVVLFTLRNVPPKVESRFRAFRCVAGRTTSEKISALEACLAGERRDLVHSVQQLRLLSLPNSPVLYWLGPDFLALLSDAPRLNTMVDIRQGMATANNTRFLRFWWEVRGPSSTWRLYGKGGGYQKWRGLEHLTFNYGENGRLFRAYEQSKFAGTEWDGILGRKFSLVERYANSLGVVYSQMANGSLSPRLWDGGFFDVKSIAVFERPDGKGLTRHEVAGLLSTHYTSFLLRALTQNLEFHAGYTGLLPVPNPTEWREEVSTLAQAAEHLKGQLVSRDPLEISFEAAAEPGKEAWWDEFVRANADAVLLLTIEACINMRIAEASSLGTQSLQLIETETGRPAGLFPLLVGYDLIGEIPESVPGLSKALARHMAKLERVTFDEARLAALKRELIGLFAAGPGGDFKSAESAENDGSTLEEDGDEEPVPVGSFIRLPSETFLEELSKKLQVHPISVFRLLQDSCKTALPKGEVSRGTQDSVSILILRMLGHQWPREIQAERRELGRVDPEGIIPITDGTNEPTLYTRIRERLTEEVGAALTRAYEREFQDIVGVDLNGWLATAFFKRHVTQFRSRPVVLQIESTSTSHGKRAGRRSARKAPVFSCLLYYHALNADALPKLRTQYVGPLRVRLQTELAGLDGISRTAEQDTRRLDLEEKIEELKAFDARIAEVILGGFASSALDSISGGEPLDMWTSRNGRALKPASHDAFLAQECRYDPDLNDGVRVNIAPLQRVGVLAADVLAAKDVEKAIADRAEWRADERRWCREGKLPQPGWWPPSTKKGVKGQ